MMLLRVTRCIYKFPLLIAKLVAPHQPPISGTALTPAWSGRAAEQSCRQQLPPGSASRQKSHYLLSCTAAQPWCCSKQNQRHEQLCRADEAEQAHLPRRSHTCEGTCKAPCFTSSPHRILLQDPHHQEHLQHHPVTLRGPTALCCPPQTQWCTSAVWPHLDAFQQTSKLQNMSFPQVRGTLLCPSRFILVGHPRFKSASMQPCCPCCCTRPLGCPAQA